MILSHHILLHVCCAPCSSYVLEYLNKYFNITALFYNPNISTDEEYNHRAKELIRFINEKDFENPIKTVISDYIPQEFMIWLKDWKIVLKVVPVVSNVID